MSLAPALSIGASMDESLIMELKAELLAENPEFTPEQIEEAIYGAKGDRAVVAPTATVDAAEDDEEEEEEAAMELLRRRYADNQARKEVESALRKLEVLDSGGELPADEEPAADGKAAEPEMEEDGPPDDSWMLASARSAARKELTPDERVAKDEELYNAAGEGKARMVERLLGEGATIDGFKSEAKSVAIHPAAARGHVAVVAVLLEVGATSALAAKNKFRQSALDLAKKHNQTAVVQQMKRFQATTGR